MRESEWLNETGNAQWMANYLGKRGVARTKAGRRKLRLFACGCCRIAWDLLPDDRLRDAVEVAERFAEGQATKEELAAAGDRVSWMQDDSAMPPRTPAGVRVAIDMVVGATYAQSYAAAFAMTAMSLPLAGRLGRGRAGEARLCDLVRCVFSNPFRPATLEPSWATSSVEIGRAHV